MVCGKSNRNISFNQFYILGYFQLCTTMFKLLLILFIIKMHARNNIFKRLLCYFGFYLLLCWFIRRKIFNIFVSFYKKFYQQLYCFISVNEGRFDVLMLGEEREGPQFAILWQKICEITMCGLRTCKFSGCGVNCID